MEGVSVYDPSQNEMDTHKRWCGAMKRAQALQPGGMRQLLPTGLLPVAQTLSLFWSQLAYCVTFSKLFCLLRLQCVIKMSFILRNRQEEIVGSY